jgi:hypothetical protein
MLQHEPDDLRLGAGDEEGAERDDLPVHNGQRSEKSSEPLIWRERTVTFPSRREKTEERGGPIRDEPQQARAAII